MIWTGLLIEIRKQCALEEAEEDEPKPEPDGLEVDCIWHHGVSGHWFEQAESGTRQWIMRSRASYWEDSGGPEKAFVLPDCSDRFLQVETCIATCTVGALEMMQLTRTHVKRNCFLLELFLVCLLVFFENCSWPLIYIFLWSKYIVQNHPPLFNIAFVRIYVSTNVAGVGTTYDVNLGDDCKCSRTRYSK